MTPWATERRHDQDLHGGITVNHPSRVKNKEEAGDIDVYTAMNKLEY
jgi:hypothetical protein